MSRPRHQKGPPCQVDQRLRPWGPFPGPSRQLLFLRACALGVWSPGRSRRCVFCRGASCPPPK
eukprot:6697787-Pyramimonas_sp.AAC.1